MNVNAHQARDLALRILGLYCVLQFIQHVPRAAWLGTMNSEQSYPGNPAVEMFGEIAVVVFYLVAGYLLLRRTEFIARCIWRTKELDSESQGTIPLPTTAFWVQLIGVYFLVWSLANLAAVIWYWMPGFRFDSEHMPTSNVTSLIRYGVMLVLAIVCIRRPDAPFRIFRPEPISDDEVLDS